MSTPAITGSIYDPKFRTERARLAGKASQSNAAIIKRFLTQLPKLTDEQVDIVRRALPPVEAADADGGT